MQSIYANMHILEVTLNICVLSTSKQIKISQLFLDSDVKTFAEKNVMLRYFTRHVSFGMPSSLIFLKRHNSFEMYLLYSMLWEMLNSFSNSAKSFRDACFLVFLISNNYCLMERRLKPPSLCYLSIVVLSTMSIGTYFAM